MDDVFWMKYDVADLTGICVLDVVGNSDASSPYAGEVPSVITRSHPPPQIWTHGWRYSEIGAKNYDSKFYMYKESTLQIFGYLDLI